MHFTQSSLVTSLRCSAFAAVALLATGAQAQVTLPQNLSYGGSSDAFKITSTGPGRALVGVINNPASGVSSVWGVNNGAGAGILGQNNGTRGSAGKFDNLNAGNSYPALKVKTAGYGPAGRFESLDTGGYFVGGYTGISATGFERDGVSAWSQNGFGIRAASMNGYGIRASTVNGEFAGYFDGNVHVNGVFTHASDREQKTDARDIDAADMLERVAQLPMQSWAFNRHPEVRHVGPYAQDFRAAFGLGGDDKSISPVDVSGVTLVAVQELHRRLAQQDEKVRALEAQLAELAATKR